MNPPRILDPIIMTLAIYYQEPMCLEPLDSDPDKNGSKSDHRIVVSKPISVIKNKSGRQFHEIKVRPFPESGIKKMQEWLADETWKEVLEAESAHVKAATFQNVLINKLDEFFPEKTRKISNDDQLWITYRLKMLERKRKRIFHKERRSENGLSLTKMLSKDGY